MVASSGGKVVKNVAGYDLGKLFSGSRGRLGLVARLALRLHPRPAAEATVVADSDDPRALWLELQRSQLEPSAVDFLPPGRLAASSRAPRPPSRPRSAACPGKRADGDDLGRERAIARPRPPGGPPSPGRTALLARPGRRDRLPRRRAAERPWSPLAERVRASFDPEGMLA